MVGECLVVNPGECSGVLSGRKTVALIDEKDAKIVDLSEG
jgi:hypothetical protein